MGREIGLSMRDSRIRGRAENPCGSDATALAAGMGVHSASSMASARPPSIPSMTWEWVSRVMEMLAWPSSSWTYFECLPATRSIVAQVWRRSWNLIVGFVQQRLEAAGWSVPTASLMRKYPLNTITLTASRSERATKTLRSGRKTPEIASVRATRS